MIPVAQVVTLENEITNKTVFCGIKIVVGPEPPWRIEERKYFDSLKFD
jgi:hypothetical protein